MSNDAETAKANTNSDISSSKSEIYWNESPMILAHQVSLYGTAAGYCISAPLLSIINKCTLWTAKPHRSRSSHLLTMWIFLPAALIFYLSLFTNSEILLHANVDVFIVFRSIVPLFVAVRETLFLKQPWPSISTWISLATIFGGDAIYVLTDHHLSSTAYSWALAYIISMLIDLFYIKHVVMTIGINTWGLVMYNNLEALTIRL